MRSEGDSQGPSLDFEWELAVFRGARRIARAVSGWFARTETPEAVGAEAAALGDRERTLTVLAQIVAGAPVRVRSSAGAGGVVGATLWLPRVINVAASQEANERLYVVRAALAASLYREGPPSALPSSPEERAALEAARAEAAARALAERFAAFPEAYARACRVVLAARPAPESFGGPAATIEAVRRAALERGAGGLVAPHPGPPRDPRVSPPVVLWGELGCPDPRLDEPVARHEARPPERGAAQAEAKAVENVKLVTLDPKELADAVLQHSFEKVETLDEHHGGARNLDGNDDLAAHAEAMEEVRLGKVVRSDQAVHAVLRADVGLSSGVPDVTSAEPAARGLPYDEWDGARREYKKAWCTVYPSTWKASDEAWGREAARKHAPLVREVTRAIEARRSRLAPQKAQPDGHALDLDAMVRHLAAKSAYEAGTPRLYVRRSRQRRDVATTILLDVSLSSDAWVDDRRVLDVSREGAIVLGEVADQLGDALQILCFSSHTRNRCDVWEVRGWDTSWSVGRARLGGLAARGYTRIGPALRHATRELAKHPARQRLLLLVSDGKPTDYDRYEGRHGVADVRQAVREADRLGVRVHGLTVDRGARDYLPAMLGQGRWHILTDVRALPRALATIYGELAG